VRALLLLLRWWSLLLPWLLQRSLLLLLPLLLLLLRVLCKHAWFHQTVSTAAAAAWRDEQQLTRTLLRGVAEACENDEGVAAVCIITHLD